MTKPLHVLIIDDSEDDRDLYQRLLQREIGIESIDLAEDGKEGLALYRERGADCVLLDFNMPGDNGLTVLRQLKSLDPLVAVVMMTSAGSQVIAVSAMKSGALDYVVKDTITAAVLERAMSNATEKAALVRTLAQQREEQTNFIRVLVHDIRAPLRGLTSFTEILEEDISAGVYEEVTDHLDMIKTSAMRINAFVDTLAHYALLDRDIAYDIVSMDEVMTEMLDHLHMTIEERGAQIDVGPLPKVTGHKPQLVQLFQNLIGNGIKYNQSSAPAIKVAVEARGEDWQFVIEDNGVGIPEDKLNMVFEPFQRLWSQDVYEGTGLGLAICRKIVERHDGQIWCESKEGQGSRFFVRLPSS